MIIGPFVSHVGVEAKVDHPGVGQAELNLVDQQLLIQCLLEHGDLLGVEVGNAEVPHFTGYLELIKGRRDLFRFH